MADPAAAVAAAAAPPSIDVNPSRHGLVTASGPSTCSGRATETSVTITMPGQEITMRSDDHQGILKNLMTLAENNAAKVPAATAMYTQQLQQQVAALTAEAESRDVLLALVVLTE